MDQQLNSLDPKLREAYERVMGTTTTPKVQPAVHADPTAQQPASTQSPVNTEAAKPAVLNTPVVSQAINQTIEQNPAPINVMPPAPPKEVQNQTFTEEKISPEPVLNLEQKTESKPSDIPLPQQSNAANTFDAGVANNQMHAYVAQEVAGVKQSLKLIQLMYIVGGVVFFAVYAFFWMNFFNVASPF